MCGPGSGKKEVPVLNLIPFPLFPLFSFHSPPLSLCSFPSELLQWVWAEPSQQGLLMHSGLKITLPMIALLQKNRDNQMRIVTRVGTATHRYAISQKGSGSIVLSRSMKCRHGIQSQTVRLPVLII